MSLARYALLVAGVVAGSLALFAALLGGRTSVATLEAAALGGALAAANTLLAYSLVLWSERRSPQVFLGAVLGGMLGRLGLLLAAVVGAVLGLGLPKVPLAVSLLAYFTFFLVLELAILHRRTSAQREAR